MNQFTNLKDLNLEGNNLKWLPINLHAHLKSVENLNIDQMEFDDVSRLKFMLYPI